MKWLRFPRVLGVAVCLYLVGLSVVFGYLSSESYHFVHGATRVEGTVIGLEVRPAAGSTRQPTARDTSPPTAPRVRYTVDGRTYEYVAAHGRYRQKLKIGDRVEVLYDPDNPERARIRGEGKVLIPLITSGFVTAALLVGLVLLLTRRAGTTDRAHRADRADPGRSTDDEPEPDDVEPALGSSKHRNR